MGKKKKLIKSLTEEIELLRESNEARHNMLVSANKRAKELEAENKELREVVNNKITLWDKDINSILELLHEKMAKGGKITIEIIPADSQSSKETQLPDLEEPKEW